jgi:serine/threonine protein kinase/Tol biopolymer transport system component
VVESPLDTRMNSPQPPLLIRFADFELDLRARELRKDGRSTGLPDQSITVLAMLLEQLGELVLREEIRTKLWPNDTVVEFDHSINSAIGRLRTALGDSAEKPQFIETLPRRGYRWIGPAVSKENREQIEIAPAAVIELSPQRISDSNLIGKKVSHYRVLEVLGGGGMGVVYKAEDLKLGRRVALKFLPEELASDSAARQRFESEARSASALNHPNICTIYGVEEFEGQPFLAMELLQGQTLRDMIVTVPPGKPQLGLTRLVDLAVQITQGLEAAHRQGIIHRDIKPANIFVTSEDQAKILDFGLAKLSPAGPAAAESPSAVQRDYGPPATKHESESLTASSPFLSRTGVAMGTAGYMSPEQIRGEKLDLRTDLFSFGLVLHEMATGKRAFAGDTAAELQNAILTRKPGPARELNPELPVDLERIIGKALEKNREARYQSASEMCSDLEMLQEEIEPRRRARWPQLATAAIVVIFMTTGALWYARRQPSSTSVLPQIKMRQLTSVSSENGPAGGKISPDGKYLAYGDRTGLHLQLIETGKTQAIPPAEGVNSNTLSFGVGPWLPDNKGFLANACLRGGDTTFGTSHGCSIWIFSISGGPPRKIRDEATGESFSPDGSLLSFETNVGKYGDREIWVMRPDGQEARKVFEVGDNDTIGGLTWSPDGQRVIYVRQDGPDTANTYFVSGDLKGGPLTKILPPFDPKMVGDLNWWSDGRLMYRLDEPGFKVKTCNLWQINMDPRLTEFIGKPQRLTNFAELCVTATSMTLDGKRFGVFEWRPHSSVYVAGLQAGGERSTNPFRLTLDESWNHPLAWTADSKTILFNSSRTGVDAIFEQTLGQDTAESLISFNKGEGLTGACLSPEGSWIYYTLTSYEEGPAESSKIMRAEQTAILSAPTTKIMRVAITGGAPQLVLTASIEEWPRCARLPSTLCAIAERTPDRKQIVFTAFDPVNGRGRELARSNTEPRKEYHWDLSPDGSRIALLKHRAERVQILSLTGAAPLEITSKGWNTLSSVVWTADGKGLFVSSYTARGADMLHMDSQGNTRLLWEHPGGVDVYGVPSPDGRHLAMRGWNVEGNMWMMENF